MNVAFSAMPVTMPGSVIGSTTSRLTTSRPKNRYRCTANAAMVPSTSAIAVAPRPTTTELASDFHMPSLFHAVDPPLCREAGRRERECARGVEGIDQYESQRNIEE